MNSQEGNDTSASQTDVLIPESHICRICMEAPQGLEFIVPCKCQGSLKHVHEVCLKVWIISRHPRLERPRCELCNEYFAIVRTSSSRCTPQRAFRESRLQCLLLIVLILGQGWIVAATVPILEDLLRSSETGQVKSEALSLIILSALATVIFLASIVHTAKESCITSSQHQWSVLSTEAPIANSNFDNKGFLQPS